MIKAIPCLLMRGGTSRGAYFLASDLPADQEQRDNCLLQIIGTATKLGSEQVDPSQVNGTGGSTTVTSKTAIISKAPTNSRQDIDYLFAQVSTDRAFVDTAPSCGNILSAVGHAAIERGLIKATTPETRVIIRNVNTNSFIEAVIQTPNGEVQYEGDTRIDGVVGSGAPVLLNFMDIIGSQTGSMFPSGNRTDTISGIDVTLIDVAVPMLLINAKDLGLIGNESAAILNDNNNLLTQIEKLRLEASEIMGLGDATGRVIPKVALVSPPQHDGSLTSRYFVPAACHPTHAVTGSICVAAAACEPDTIAFAVAKCVAQTTQTCIIEHPQGTIATQLTYKEQQFIDAGAIRTARKIMDGKAFVCLP